MGTTTDTCQFTDKKTDMNDTPYSEEYKKENTVTEWKRILSYTGHTNSTCPIEVHLSSGSVFYGEMDINDVELVETKVDAETTETISSTGNEYFEFPLYRNKSEVGNSDLVAMTLRLNFDGNFSFYTTNGIKIIK